MAALLAIALLFAQDAAPAEDRLTSVEPEPEAVVEEAPAPPVPTLSTPHAYLYASYPALARRLDCMIRLESTWNPGAVSAGGRYVGLAQFDMPTWYETPPGKAGASRWDPYASIDAMAWGVGHLGYGRWPVTSRRC